MLQSKSVDWLHWKRDILHRVGFVRWLAGTSRRIAVALFAGMAAALAVGGPALAQASMPTQSVDIPLQYVFDSSSNQARLAIYIGINGGPPQPYLFDTGSALFNAAYNPNTWNGFVQQSRTPTTWNGIQLCYSGSTPLACRGYTGNIVQVPMLSFYQAGGSTPVTTFTATPGFQINAAYSYTDSTVIPNINDSFPGYFNDPSAGPPQEGLFYGVFGARASVDLLNKGCTMPNCYISGGVFGQTIVSGAARQGYIVAANGQPNPANAFSPGGLNQPLGNQIVTVGGQTRPVTWCSPCVTVGLTPQLIGQFAPVGLPTQTPALPGLVPWISPTAATPAPPFPNPYGGATGNNSAPTDGTMFSVTLTPSGGSPMTYISAALLDTGTRFFNVNSNFVTNSSTGSISIVGVTPSSGSIPGLPSSTSTLTGGPSYSVSVTSSSSDTIGIPFFMQNSVMFDLSDEAIGYTPYFVTDAPLVTTANGPLIIGSSNVPLGLAGVISGPGGVVIQSGGAAQLSATNTYTGLTMIAGASGSTPAGQLLIAGPGSIANSAGVVNNGVFDISRAWSSVAIQTLSGTGQVFLGGQNLMITNGSTTFSGTMTDGGAFPATGGSLTVAGGTLTFAGTGTYTGGTAVIGGTLVLSGSLGGVLATFPGGTFNLAPGGTFAGMLANFGNSAINGVFTGIVANLGTLSGTGAIVGNVFNGGMVAPGNGLGTLSVVGGYTQSSAGGLMAMVQGGQSNLLNITGAAALQGGTVQVAALPGSVFAPTTTYTILKASSGLTGTFSAVSDPYPFLVPSLSYDANNAYLTLAINGFAAQATNSLQYAVGSVLDASALNATGDYATVLGTLATATAQQGQAFMTAISGNNYAGFSSYGVMGAQLIMNNFASQAGGGGSPTSTRVALAEACDVACDTISPARWGAWGGGLGGLGTIGANQPVGGITYNAGGFAAGLDRLVTDTLRVGVTAGYTAGSQWVGGFTGMGRSDTFQTGLYANFAQDKVYADALVGYAYTWNQMWRQIAIPGLQPRTALGQTGANQFFGQIETGYRFDLGTNANAFVTPFARLQAYTGNQNAFTETGAQSLNLTIAQQTTNSLRSVIGAQVGGSMDLGWREKLFAQLRLGWSHEYANVGRPVTATLAGAPGLPFTTWGVSPQIDGAVIGLSANTAIADATSVYFRYEGLVSGQDNAHAFTAGLRMTW
jgi:uncharacterized protein with beta-barrel porin domain